MTATNGKTAISHGSGQMRAQSISIQVSTRERCNAGCKFCISRTTPTCEEEDRTNIKMCGLERLTVGLNYAKQLGATHAVLTSRADPTQEDEDYLGQLVATCRDYLPLVDMHTNGFLLYNGPGRKGDLLKFLAGAGLTHITFSIASHEAEQNKELMVFRQSALDLIPYAVDLGLLVRCSLVINKMGIATVLEILKYIQAVGQLGAHMVVIREVWIPETTQAAVSQEVKEWNKQNWVDIGPLQEEFMQLSEKSNSFVRRLNDLPWGTPVFAVENIFSSNPHHGVNVTFARCEEGNMGTVIKSIVHRPNGHGYRNWDSMGDILY